MQQIMANATVGEYGSPSPVMVPTMPNDTAVQYIDNNYPVLRSGESEGFVKIDENGNIKGKHALNLAVEFFYENNMEYNHEGSGVGDDAGEQTPKNVVSRVMVRYRTRGQDDTEIVDWIRDHRNRINTPLLGQLRLHQQYADWVNNKNVRQQGIPLQEIPGITPDQIAMCQTMRVTTCEHMAVLSESSNADQLLGNNWRTLKRKAQQLVQINQQQADEHDMRSALAKMTERAEAAEREARETRHRLEKLEKLMTQKGPVDPTDATSVSFASDAPVEAIAKEVPTLDRPGAPAE